MTIQYFAMKTKYAWWKHNFITLPWRICFLWIYDLPFVSLWIVSCGFILTASCVFTFFFCGCIVFFPFFLIYFFMRWVTRRAYDFTFGLGFWPPQCGTRANPKTSTFESNAFFKFVLFFKIWRPFEFLICLMWVYSLYRVWYKGTRSKSTK